MPAVGGRRRRRLGPRKAEDGGGRYMEEKKGRTRGRTRDSSQPGPRMIERGHPSEMDDQQRWMERPRGLRLREWVPS